MKNPFLFRAIAVITLALCSVAQGIENGFLEFHNRYLRGTDYRTDVDYPTPPEVYWAWSKLGIAVGSDVAIVLTVGKSEIVVKKVEKATLAADRGILLADLLRSSEALLTGHPDESVDIFVHDIVPHGAGMVAEHEAGRLIPFVRSAVAMYGVTRADQARRQAIEASLSSQAEFLSQLSFMAEEIDLLEQQIDLLPDPVEAAAKRAMLARMTRRCVEVAAYRQMVNQSLANLEEEASLRLDQLSRPSLITGSVQIQRYNYFAPPNPGEWSVIRRYINGLISEADLEVYLYEVVSQWLGNPADTHVVMKQKEQYVDAKVRWLRGIRDRVNRYGGNRVDMPPLVQFEELRARIPWQMERGGGMYVAVGRPEGIDEAFQVEERGIFQSLSRVPWVPRLCLDYSPRIAMQQPGEREWLWDDEQSPFALYWRSRDHDHARWIGAPNDVSYFHPAASRICFNPYRHPATSGEGRGGQYELFKKYQIPARLQLLDGTPVAGQNRLIVTLHGTRVSHVTGQVLDDEMRGLAEAIQQELTSNHPGWVAIHYDWSLDAEAVPLGAGDHGQPSYALQIESEAAYLHGWSLGRLLAAQSDNLAAVQFIADGPGAWIARSAALYLLDQTGAEVQVTLLSPHFPQRTSYGHEWGGARMADLVQDRMARLELYRVAGAPHWQNVELPWRLTDTQHTVAGSRWARVGEYRANPLTDWYRSTIGTQGAYGWAISLPRRPQPRATVLLVDTSGSMGWQNKLERAQQSIRSLLAMTDPASLWTLAQFDRQGRIVIADVRADSADLVAAVAGLRAGGGTDISRGLSVVLDRLDRQGETTDVLLLADGQHGGALQAALDRCIRMGVRVFTIGFGDDAEWDVLEDIARQTGGRLISADGGSLMLAMQSQLAGLQDDHTVATIRDVIQQDEWRSHSVDVIPNTDYLRMALAWMGSRIDLVLQDPHGRLWNSDALRQAGVRINEDWANNLVTVDLLRPTAGRWYAWTFGADIPASGEPYSLAVVARQPVKAWAIPLLPSYQPGSPVRFGAYVELPNLPVDVLIHRPGRPPFPVPVNDRGMHGDQQAGDRLHSAVVTVPERPGYYPVEIRIGGPQPFVMWETLRVGDAGNLLVSAGPGWSSEAQSSDSMWLVVLIVGVVGILLLVIPLALLVIPRLRYEEE